MALHVATLLSSGHFLQVLIVALSNGQSTGDGAGAPGPLALENLAGRSGQALPDGPAENQSEKRK